MRSIRQFYEGGRNVGNSAFEHSRQKSFPLLRLSTTRAREPRHSELSTYLSYRSSDYQDSPTARCTAGRPQFHARWSRDSNDCTPRGTTDTLNKVLSLFSTRNKVNLLNHYSYLHILKYFKKQPYCPQLPHIINCYINIEVVSSVR